MSSPVDVINSYISQQRWFELLSYLASLDATTRSNLFQLIAETMKPEDWIHAVAFNAVLTTGRYSDVIALVDRILPDAKQRLLSDLPDIIGSRVTDLVNNGRYQDLKAEASETSKVLNMIPDAEGRKKAETYYWYALCMSDDDIRGFIDAVNGRKWIEAHTYLERIEQGNKTGTLRSYLASVGQNYDTVKRYVIQNYVLAAIGSAKSEDEALSILERYRDYLPDDVKKILSDAKRLAELRKAAQSKDWKRATEIIDSAPAEIRRSLAEAFIYMVKDSLTVDDFDQLKSFAQRYGVAEIANALLEAEKASKEAVEEAVNEATNQMINTVVSELSEALTSRDRKKIQAVAEKYGDVLDSVQINGVLLRDILDASLKYIELKPKMDFVFGILTDIETKMNAYFEAKKSDPKIQFNVNLSNIDRALSYIDEIKAVKDRIVVLDGIFVQNLRQFLDELDNYKAYLLIAKAMYYFDRNDRRAIQFAEEATKLNPMYADTYAIIKATFDAEAFKELECILRKAGIEVGTTGGGGGRATRVTGASGVAVT